MKSRWTFWVVLIAYGLGAWLYSVPFVGDQKVYISTAREMWEHSHFLHPYLFGETSYYKPPWLFWTLLAGWKFFGFNLFGTFFFSILATAGTAFFLDLISRELTRERADARVSQSLAGIWFAACTGTLTYGTTAQMEIWVVFFYSLAWYCFIRHFKSGKFQWLLLGLVVSGLSALNKSPLYSVFSVLTYSAFLLIAPVVPSEIRGSSGPFSPSEVRRWFLSPRFYLAHLAGVGVGLSWFIGMMLTDRERFWTQYVLQETFGKQGGNGGSILHMWGDLLTFTVPFTFLLIPALIGLPRLKREQLIFLGCWMILPAAFFSYFPYRTETYLYILVPALALLLDWSLGVFREGAGVRPFLKGTARVTSVLVGVGIFGLVIFFGASSLIQLPWIFLLLIAGGIFIVHSWRLSSTLSLDSSTQLRLRSLAYSALGLILALRFCAFSLGENDIRGLRAVLEQFPERKLAFLDDGRNIWHEVDLMSVVSGKPALRLFSEDQMHQALQKGAILVLTPDQKDLFSKALPGQQEVQWWRLQRRFAIPTFNDLKELGDRKNRRQFRLVWRS